jgi:hypothetical protein
MKTKEVSLCPKCKRELRIVERKPNGQEKRFFKEMGSDILVNHKDVWMVCDKCAFVHHLTIANGKVLLCSNFISREHVKNL